MEKSNCVLTIRQERYISVRYRVKRHVLTWFLTSSGSPASDAVSEAKTTDGG